jgi:hypothetical protein
MKEHIIHVRPDTTGGYASEELVEAYIESPPPEASSQILELLKTEAKAWVAQDFPRIVPTPLFSPIAREIIELQSMPEGEKKKKKEDSIIDKIKEKLQLARSVAEKLRPASYSVGVGFPFGISISFTWSHREDR